MPAAPVASSMAPRSPRPLPRLARSTPTTTRRRRRKTTTVPPGPSPYHRANLFQVVELPPSRAPPSPASARFHRSIVRRPSLEFPSTRVRVRVRVPFRVHARARPDSDSASSRPVPSIPSVASRAGAEGDASKSSHPMLRGSHIVRLSFRDVKNCESLLWRFL